MGKIPGRTVNSDDCVVYVGRRMEEHCVECNIVAVNGTCPTCKKRDRVEALVVEKGVGYDVHKGESVVLLPVGSVAQYMTVLDMQDAVASKNEAALKATFNRLCAELAAKVLSWNWTDMDGNPMPPPHGHPEVLAALTEDELSWLLRAVQGETPAERKNGCGPSAPTS
jgi:hypothetical protein